MLGNRSTPGPSPRRTEEAIQGVPSDKVEQIRQDFQDSGAVEVIIKPQADGTYIVTAIYSD